MFKTKTKQSIARTHSSSIPGVTAEKTKEHGKQEVVQPTDGKQTVYMVATVYQEEGKDITHP